MPDEPSANPPLNPDSTADSAVPRRKGPPFWVGLLFVLLLGGGYAVTQWITFSGPSIAWRYDYDAALAEAKTSKKRVFLLLHEPGCRITAANERELLSTRDVRNRLALMIPCRLELKPGDPRRKEFGFDDQPLMLCIDRSGALLGRLAGRVSDAQFRTHMKAE